MAAGASAKILVLGSIQGSLTAFVAKLSSINKKNGPFDLCLCLGDFLGVSKGEGNEGTEEQDEDQVDALLQGKIVLPLPTYFTFGGKPFSSKVIKKIESGEGELAENLYFLGKQAITKLSSGLRIAVFGADYDLNAYTESIGSAKNALTQPNFTASNVSDFKSSLASSSHPVDILVTHAWPTQIAHLSSKPVNPEISASGSPAISEILATARPRYHFVAGQPVFWEREPFSWPAEKQPIATRFISLAPFNNAEKQRWFYAFNLEVVGADRQPTLPPNCTECPLTSSHAMQQQQQTAASSSSKKRRFEDVDEAPADYRFGGAAASSAPVNGQQNNKNKKGTKRKGPPPEYTCRLCNQQGHWIQDCEMAQRPNNRAARGPKEINPDQCWFCLSNPKLSKHLIVSIGAELYLALPKGQLPFVEVGTPVPGGGHVLLVTVAHFSTLRSLPIDQQKTVNEELDNFMSALTKCYAKYNCQPLSFEVGRAGMHAHTQICPIPSYKAGNAEKVFRDAAAANNLLLEEDADTILDERNISENYFRVTLPNGKALVHVMQPNQHFNLQFGRIALASLLGTPERADWKQCARSDEEEKAECQAFAKAFAAFDPAE